MELNFRIHILPLRAEEGSRTPDLLITNQLLYQLSYFGLFKELAVYCLPVQIDNKNYPQILGMQR
ncbi:MAG: hypothetical protein JWM28_2500 [Chitinophagaceae bacterium]|nr:hypothetical protein [Chitinophagaceae bacterium]